MPGWAAEVGAAAERNKVKFLVRQTDDLFFIFYTT